MEQIWKNYFGINDWIFGNSLFSFSIFTGCVLEKGEKTKEGAATTKKPVTYVSEDDIQKVYAKPVKSEGSCEWITVQYYEYGKLVKEKKN